MAVEMLDMLGPELFYLGTCLSMPQLLITGSCYALLCVCLPVSLTCCSQVLLTVVLAQGEFHAVILVKGGPCHPGRVPTKLRRCYTDSIFILPSNGRKANGCAGHNQCTSLSTNLSIHHVGWKGTFFKADLAFYASNSALS